MPKKTAARSPRGREKSAPKAPSIKAFRVLEQRQGELIQLQHETLRQVADALTRIGKLESEQRAAISRLRTLWELRGGAPVQISGKGLDLEALTKDLAKPGRLEIVPVPADVTARPWWRRLLGA